MLKHTFINFQAQNNASMKYILPENVINTFLSHAVNNFSWTEPRHIETLAFVVGKKIENEVTATDIMFPQQEGTPSHVSDSGKNVYYSI